MKRNQNSNYINIKGPKKANKQLGKEGKSSKYIYNLAI